MASPNPDHHSVDPRHRRSLEGASWRWFDDMESVPWDTWSALPGPTAYLDPRYFRAMSGHGKVQCRIGLLHDANGHCVGGIQMQSVLSESRNPSDHLEVSTGVRLFMGLLQPGGRPFRFRTLVAGQGLGTGEHTFRWIPEVALEDRVRWTEQAFEECAAHWSIRVWMAKDFGPDLDQALAPHWSKPWQRATFDPVMITPLDPTWTDRESWMEALRTKARTKVRSILARNSDVTLNRITDPTELRALGPDLIDLYEQVYGRASIVMGGLEADDFARLAEHWGDDFLLVTHHFEGRLVGFHCGIHHADPAAQGGTIEAYFVGFEPELNKECALYQRMLIEFIGWGISLGAAKVVMGRTAMEIKSTLGALPVPVSTWVHIRLPLAMPFIRWMVRRSPPHPFKPRKAWRAEWLERWESEGYRFNAPVPPGRGR